MKCLHNPGIIYLLELHSGLYPIFCNVATVNTKSTLGFPRKGNKAFENH